MDLFPKNLLKHLSGAALIIENCKLERNQLLAFGKAIKDRKIELVLLQNNRLND